MIIIIILKIKIIKFYYYYNYYYYYYKNKIEEITLPKTNWNSNDLIKKLKEELNVIGNNIRKKKVNEIRFSINVCIK